MLLTSHDLGDVEALCDRCILINQGQKTYDGKLDQVKGDLEGIRRVKILLNESIEKSDPLPEGIKELPCEDSDEKYFEFHLEQVPMVQIMNFVSRQYGTQLRDVQITGVRLEEIIQKHYGHH